MIFYCLVKGFFLIIVECVWYKILVNSDLNMRLKKKERKRKNEIERREGERKMEKLN